MYPGQPRGPLPAQLPGNGGLRHPRDHLQFHQEGPVRQHRHVWRHHHVPRYCLPHAEGDHRPGSLHHQDQDHRSPREEVLRLDRRLHPGFPLHLPADVDLQAGVRRVRPIHCPPQVLLSASQLPRKKNNILDPIATIFIYLSVGFSLLFYSTTLPLPFGRLTLFSSIRLSITFLLQLLLSLCLQNISSESFVRSLTVYWHHLRNIRILCVIFLWRQRTNASKLFQLNKPCTFCKMSSFVVFFGNHKQSKYSVCLSTHLLERKVLEKGKMSQGTKMSAIFTIWGDLNLL